MKIFNIIFVLALFLSTNAAIGQETFDPMCRSYEAVVKDILSNEIVKGEGLTLQVGVFVDGQVFM